MSKDSEVQERIVSAIRELRTFAPPDPNEGFFGWMQMVCRLRRALLNEMSPEELRRQLRRLLKDHDLRGGSNVTRMLIELSARPHVKAKMRNKYANTLAWARKNKIKSKDLRSFIEGQGGINRCDELYRAAAKET